MSDKKKKMKIDFTKPTDNIQQPANPDVTQLMDTSADEIQKLRQSMSRPKDSIYDETGYADGGEVQDPDELKRQQLGDMFTKMGQDNSKAIGIASRSPFSETSPEEHQFASQQLGPMLQGLIGGGVSGRIANVANQEAPAAVGAFGKLKGMFQGAAPEVDAISGQALPQASQEISPMLRTSASLPATHPAMIGERGAINQMTEQMGAQHPDVILRQRNYNNILGNN